MGLTKKIQEKVHEKWEGYKQERAHQGEVRKKEKAEFKRGREEARVKTAYERGKASISGSSKKTSGKGQGVTARVGQVASGVGKGLESYDTVFGVTGKGGGGGFGIGWGLGGEQPKKAPPQRITRVSKSGTVTISEPAEQHEKAREQEDPYAGFWNVAPEGKKKKQSSYDFF